VVVAAAAVIVLTYLQSQTIKKSVLT